MRSALTAAAILLAAAAGVNADCPASLTVNGVSFDPSGLKASLSGQQQMKDGAAAGTFDFAVNLCAKQPECTGDSTRQGTYYITQLNQGTTTCSNGLFESMTSNLAVSGNNLVASYVDKSGLRIANVQVSCGGTSALSSSSNSFSTSLNQGTSTTTFTFNYQSNLICGSGPTPTPSGPNPPGPNVVVTTHATLTWGGVFMILFFVGLLVYVLAAVGFNYYKGQRGSDLAPHPGFWKSLPYLFLDGIKFTSAKLLALCGKGDGTFVSSAPAGGGASGDSGKATSGYSAI